MTGDGRGRDSAASATIAGFGNIEADDRRRLDDRPLLAREPVEAGGQQRLDRGRDASPRDLVGDRPAPSS